MDATLFVVNTRFANKDHINNALEVLNANPKKNTAYSERGAIKKSKYYYNTNYGYGQNAMRDAYAYRLRLWVRLRPAFAQEG
ncbi:MAG: hypothetical protein R2818_15825 [Flavobacteriales bacterium]